MKRLYKECFAYDENRRECICLKELICKKTDKCSFYKHKLSVNWKEIERAIKDYANPVKQKRKEI